jgi:flagellar protein FliJ
MKPFTLDTVLQHRKSLEDQAAHLLVKAQEEEKSVQLLLNKEEEVLKVLINTLAHEQTLGIEVVKLARFEQRIILINKQIQALQTLLQKKKEGTNRAHEHLIAKSKDRKIMETLQQKQDEAWRHYLNKKETTALDEIAVIFHNRE